MQMTLCFCVPALGQCPLSLELKQKRSSAATGSYKKSITVGQKHIDAPVRLLLFSHICASYIIAT